MPELFEMTRKKCPWIDAFARKHVEVEQFPKRRTVLAQTYRNRSDSFQDGRQKFSDAVGGYPLKIRVEGTDVIAVGRSDSRRHRLTLPLIDRMADKRDPFELTNNLRRPVARTVIHYDDFHKQRMPLYRPQHGSDAGGLVISGNDT